MAFRFCDSANHYATSNILRKWTTGSFVTIDSAGGRDSLGALKVIPGGGVAKTLTHKAKWILGVAFAFDAEPNGGTLLSISNNNVILCSVRFNEDHTFTLKAGGNIAGTSEVAVSADVTNFNYVEMKAELKNGGPITVDASIRLNGEVILTVTGASTGVNSSSLLSNSTTANVVGLGSSVNVFSHIFYDDFYACDGTADGFGHDDYLGDVTIDCVYENGDITTDFATHGGSGSHFNRVNEHSPDDDTTYVFDTTVAHKEEFDWEDISSFAGTLVAVHYLCYARKDDQGSKSFKQTMGGAAIGDEHFVSDYYVYYSTPLDSNGGSAWTVTNFNSQTFGAIIES